MASLLRMLESCLLVAMGTFMAVLSQSSMYWQFLNPRYSWLTFTSGVILAAIGFICLFHTQRGRKISECIGIAVFLTLAVIALNTFEYEYEEGPMPMGSLTGEYGDDQTPTMTVDGQEYIRINTAELLSGEAEGFVSPGQAFALQGAVVRSPELDEAGYIALGRLLITCCFADSTATVALVKVDDPTQYRHGSWVQALGVLEEGSPFPGTTITLTGALTGVRSDKYILRGTRVEEQPVEGVPFIFEIRNEQPFAY